MSNTERLGVGKKIEALALKVSDIQRELAGLRQDVKRLMYLLGRQETGATGDEEATDEVEEHERPPAGAW